MNELTSLGRNEGLLESVRSITSVRLQEIGALGDEGTTGEDAVSISLPFFNLAISAGMAIGILKLFSTAGTAG
jgi:hypothetical protein